MKMVEVDRLFYGVGEVRADVTFPINQDILGKLLKEFFLGVKRIIFRNRRGELLPPLNLKRLSDAYDNVWKSSQKVFGSDLEWSHIADTLTE